MKRWRRTRETPTRPSTSPSSRKPAAGPEQAKESLLRALTIEPAKAPAHFNVAALYEQSGENARAIEHYRSFLENAGAEHASRTPDARARLDALARSR